MKSIFNILLILVLLIGCKKAEEAQTPKLNKEDTSQVKNEKTLEQRMLELKASNTSRDSLLLANYLMALDNFNNDPSATNFIWLGRRIAYTGQYNDAINVYSKGIHMFAEDARLFRHRGHRYISTRQFDKAIADLEHAADLIKGTEDRIEPDGIPNKLNQPVSSLHTNIWYHLGLAYYLKNDLGKALNAFQHCLQTSKNDDMIVATSHWLYMIQRRLNNSIAAEQILESISENMTIIENDGYHKLLLFYKGNLSQDELKGNGATGSSEAVKYGIANWYHYNGDVGRAVELYQELVSSGHPYGFGFIAAESDLKRI